MAGVACRAVTAEAPAALAALAARTFGSSSSLSATQKAVASTSKSTAVAVRGRVLRTLQAARATAGAHRREPPQRHTSTAHVRLARWLSLVQVAEENIPRTTLPGQAFVGDLRSTSGLGVGDGIKTHTGKWLQGETKVGWWWGG